MSGELRPPNQEELDRLFAAAARVHIIDHPPNGPSLDFRTHEEIREIAGAVRMGGDMGSICMCLGDIWLDLHHLNGTRMARVQVHHGSSLYVEGWATHGVLDDPPRLEAWLEEHGIDGPHHRREERAHMQAESEEAERLWRSTIPPCLADLAEAMLETSRSPERVPVVVDAGRERLVAAHPDLRVRVLTLLRWMAAGSGRLTGYPMYEVIPGQLLLDLPTEAIVSAVTSDSAGREELDGAIRLMAGWEFRRRRRDVELPDALRARLLTRARESTDPDLVARAGRAFG